MVSFRNVHVNKSSLTIQGLTIGSMTGFLFAESPMAHTNYSIGTGFSIVNKNQYPLMVMNYTTFHLTTIVPNSWSEGVNIGVESICDIQDGSLNHLVSWNASVGLLFDGLEFLFFVTENPLRFDIHSGWDDDVINYNATLPVVFRGRKLSSLTNTSEYPDQLTIGVGGIVYGSSSHW